MHRSLGIKDSALVEVSFSLSAFERAGRPVGRVIVDGRKIELDLMSDQPVDDFERIDMRHGKT